MKYKSIKSTSGGKASQQYPGSQPLTGDKALSGHRKASKSVSGGKARQMNTNGKMS